ncbi:MAG: hypothetical protein U0840_27925 [Gemmataceae bacterium]
MITPRQARFRCANLGATLLLALLAPVVALADTPAHLPSKSPSSEAKKCPVSVIDEDDDGISSATPSVQAKVAGLLMTTLLRSYPNPKPKTQPRPKKLAPPSITSPMVVSAPIRPADVSGFVKDKPGFPTENPNGVPEPASLVTGLVGAGLAAMGWVRHRRRVRGAVPAEPQLA